MRGAAVMRASLDAPAVGSLLVYESPFTPALKRVKLFSMSSCVLSIVSAPVMLSLSNVPLAGRTAITIAVVAFGTLTTVVLSKFTGPYITRIFLPPPQAAADTATSSLLPPAGLPAAPGADVMTLETLNYMARPRYWRVPASTLRPLPNTIMTNVRALLPAAGGAAAAYRDFFLHCDLVEHPLLLPVAQQLRMAEAQYPQPAEPEAPVATPAADSTATGAGAAAAAAAADLQQGGLKPAEAR